MNKLSVGIFLLRQVDRFSRVIDSRIVVTKSEKEPGRATRPNSNVQQFLSLDGGANTLEDGCFRLEDEIKVLIPVNYISRRVSRLVDLVDDCLLIARLHC